jgi:hypothetical protein
MQMHASRASDGGLGSKVFGKYHRKTDAEESLSRGKTWKEAEPALKAFSSTDYAFGQWWWRLSCGSNPYFDRRL